MESPAHIFMITTGSNIGFCFRSREDILESNTPIVEYIRADIVEAKDVEIKKYAESWHSDTRNLAIAKDDIDDYEKQKSRLLAENNRLLEETRAKDAEIKTLLSVMQVVYLYHNCGVEDYGQNELSYLMQDALCNQMGEEEFTRWLDAAVEDFRQIEGGD